MSVATAVANFKKVQEIFRLLALLQLTAHLWPKSANVQDGDNYDFIIVGGGTAGCVIASKLAEFENVKVLLIEAGGDPPLQAGLPAFFAHLKHTMYDYNVTSIQEDSLKYHKGRVSDITQGKMLGGSSSLNYMAYARGHPNDYDCWANITNDPSWNYKSVLPLLIENEKVIDKSILNSPKDKALHGTQGKLQLIKYCHRILNKYVSAYKEMGIRAVVDINSRNPLGVENILFTASKEGRQSTAVSFLSPMKHKPNLDVMKNALVIKIIFDENKNAIGVKVRTKENKTIIIKANKEVILTAGVFKSPQLLMVSGIGPKEHLDSKNIEVIANLPVGENLQDHPICVSIYKMGNRHPAEAPNPYEFTIPCLDGYYALDKSQNNPDYYVINLIVNDPEQFLVFCAISFSFTPKICESLVKRLNDKQIYTVFNILSYPESRGKVLLNTTDMEDQPKIQLNYYSEESDLEKHAKSVMQFSTIVNTTYFKSVNAELMDPELETCTQLDKNSIEYWKCYCYGMVTTSHYYAGTCSMGTVVDAKLMVKGVKRLRVADASVMPRNVASTTTGPVIMIAQKAVDMIKVQHSLNK